MSLVEIVNNVCMSELDRVASVIEGEMKAAAVGSKAHVRTGMAQASIHIEAPSEITRRIGANASFPRDGNDGGTHLYYMDQGNSGNGPGGRIYPTRAKYLKLKDGSIRRSVSTYGGKDFIKAIAARHS